MRNGVFHRLHIFRSLLIERSNAVEECRDLGAGRKLDDAGRRCGVTTKQAERLCSSTINTELEAFQSESAVN